MKKLVFFGGKGGVGKTTSSAAFALYCANNGEKTLLVSTDPAHSLCDIFEREIGSKITQLNDNLYALEIDPEEEAENYIQGIKGKMKDIVSPVIIKEVEKQLDAASVSPGSDESAVFDKLMEIILEYGEKYDRIVIDTAPTGHTLRLLSLPELLGGWMDRLMEKRIEAMELYEMARRYDTKFKKKIENDSVISTLRSRKEKMERTREILTNNELVSFVFVMNAEKLPFEETKKAINILEKYQFRVNDIIVNRLLPEELTDSFWIKRKAIEKQHLEEINRYFHDKNIIKIPLIDSEVKSENIVNLGKYFKTN